MSMIEALLVAIVISVLMGSGGAVFMRRLSLGTDLAAYTQAVLAAEHVMEFRRARGRRPTVKELADLFSALESSSPGLSITYNEERYRATGLGAVTVRVAWGRSGAAGGEVRLESLAPAP